MPSVSLLRTRLHRALAFMKAYLYLCYRVLNVEANHGEASEVEYR